MKNRLLIELLHFKQLSLEARQLLVSATIYELAYPILFTFLGAYLFRSTGGFSATVLYNVGMFIGLPFAFYANGLLLKRVSIRWLLLAGLIGQGMVASSVFLFENISLPLVFAFGFLQGFPMGFYWSNRNFVTLEVTQDEKRGYYTGLEMIIANIAGVVSPFVTGWALVFGVKWSAMTIQEVYQFLAFLATLGLIAAGVTLFKTHLKNPAFTKLWLGAINSAWSKARAREIIYGIFNGFKIVSPALLTLFILGEEGVLGTVISVAAIFSSFLLYLIARKVSVKNRKNLLIFSILIHIISTIPLAISFSQIAALFYLMLIPTIIQLTWMGHHPMQLQVIDKEDNGDSTNNYAYVADRELFLNIGRLIGVGIFSTLFVFVSNEVALRFSPLLVALLQLGFLFLL
jgi:MFS transporter, YQGE family, putative transporter